SVLSPPTDGRFCIHFNAERQEIEFLHLIQALGLSLSVERIAAVPWPITIGKPHLFRALVRREFIEVYIDDRYVHGQVIAEGFEPSRIGFFCELACGVFQQPTLWQMG